MTGILRRIYERLLHSSFELLTFMRRIGRDRSEAVIATRSVVTISSVHERVSYHTHAVDEWGYSLYAVFISPVGNFGP